MTPLRQRMIEDMQIRNLAVNTQRAYCEYVSLFARHFHKSPALLGPEEIRAYQVHLTRDRQLASSSISVAVAALRFLYKVTLKRDWNLDDVIPTCHQQHKLPVVLSRQEVASFLDAIENQCSATARMAGRVASSKNAPETPGVVAAKCTLVS